MEPPTPLPAGKLVDFDAPPVTEVVLSVQFPTPVVDIAALARFATAVRRVAPEISHQPVLPRMKAETFDRPMFQPPFQIVAQQPGLPRTWFSGKTSNYLIQLQADRITLNWRRQSPTEPYPGYIQIRRRFDRHLLQLATAVRSAGRDLPPADLCEVSYVNPVEVPGEHPEFRHPDLAAVINRVRAAPEGAFLGQPEDAQYHARWRIQDPRESDRPVGRLYLSAVPHLAGAGPHGAGGVLYMITLTAHVQPVVEEPSFDALNTGHDWVVLGFKDLTTPEMRNYWREREVR